MRSNKKLAEIAGWYGTGAIVLAYILVSFKVLPANGVPYQVLNLTGSVGLAWVSVAKGLKQTIALNFFWALIAVVALIALVVKS